jgi:hypothetical protein
MLNNQDEISKAQAKVEKLNNEFVKSATKKKQERHVKEKNEPLLDDFLDNFRNSYADDVVGTSMKEIVNFIKKKDV